MDQSTTKEHARRDPFAHCFGAPAPSNCPRCTATAQSDHAFCPRCGAPLRQGTNPSRWQSGTGRMGGFGYTSLDAFLHNPVHRPLLYVAATIFVLLVMVETARAVAGVVVLALIVFMAITWLRAQHR